MLSVVSDLNGINREKNVVVLFGVEWSEECKTFSDILETLSKEAEYKHIKFKSCSAEDHPEICEKHNVVAVPTVVFLKEGEKVDELIGADTLQLNLKVREFAGGVTSNPDPELQSILDSNKVTVCVDSDSTENKELISWLNEKEVKFKLLNVSTDNSVKKKLVDFSRCEKFPQLYVKEKFIGDAESIKKIDQSELLASVLAATKDLKEALCIKLLKLINSSDIMVFMKGSRDAPRCGFSRQLMQILGETELEFKTFDILEDEEVRQGLKVFSNWPTYPQVYVKGDLVGGIDIIKTLKADGNLLEILKPE